MKNNQQKNKEPLITVVTVCLNSEKYIEEAIKSVINQDYENIEYIIIDGGSTDGTLDIIKKYEKHITKLVSEADNGIYDAMNKGVGMASGELIGFLNSDDYYFPKAIEKIVAKYKETNADVISGKTAIVNGNRVINYHYTNFSKMDENSFSSSHPSTFVKTKLMKKYKFDTNYKIAADRKFLLNLFIKNYLFVNIPNKTAAFREGGISSFWWPRTKEKLKVDKELLGIKKSIKKNYRSFFKYLLVYMIKFFIGEKQYLKLKKKLKLFKDFIYFK